MEDKNLIIKELVDASQGLAMEICEKHKNGATITEAEDRFIKATATMAIFAMVKNLSDKES